MSSAQPIRPRQVGKASASAFAIVASQYNLEFVQGLVNHAHQELADLEPGSTTKVFWTPGAFEVPLIVKAVAAQKKYQAIIALGVIIQGETAHAGLIGQAVTGALLNLSLEFNIPIVHEVLLVGNEEQARARCGEGPMNRGIEAARAAVTSYRTIRELTIKE